MNISRARRASILLSAMLLGWGLSTAGHAALVPLADAPVFDINTVKPNIMFTLDNSGSMQETSVPDSMGGNVGRRCYKNHIANALYFNPGSTATPLQYDPPKSHNGTTTFSLPNVPFTAAPWDGYRTNAIWRDNTGGGWVNSTAPVNLSNMFRADYDYTSGHQASDGRQGAYYMRYTGTTPAVPVAGVCYADASYTRVDVTSEPAAVQQNFANWFSYYRSRMQAVKAAAGIAFSFLDNDFRIGFHTILNQTGTFRNVLDFAGTNRQNWYTTFYGVTPTNNTPLRASHIRVGEYFRTGVMGGQTGSLDPLTLSCQKNFHLLSTDGYWNEPDPTFAPGDVDGTVPPLPVPVAGLTPGAPWPNLYRQNAAAPVSPAIRVPTLSDVATYYWATDLRPSGAKSTNNVKVSLADPATWQHVSLSAISIAAQGTLPFNPKDASIGEKTLTDIKNGVLVWPHPTNLQPTTIDDLWHATVNSRGNYFNVSSPQDLAEALTKALNAFTEDSGTAAGAALANSNLGASGASNVTFVPSYTSGSWTGELTAQLLDPDTGLVINDNLWKHSAKLATQVAGNGWDTSRRLLTRADSTVVPLRLNSLTVTQKSALGAATVTAPFTTSEQQAVLNYLRGDSANEDTTVATSRKYRARALRLGDIVASEPAAVDVPIEPYADSYNPGYQAFKAANATRTPMVYFGANDGFVHAVNGEAASANAGKEVWGYMPGSLFRNDDTGIASLTYRLNDAPPKKFAHRFFVDASPFVRDVDFSRTSQSASSPTPVPAASVQPDWRSVMIIGMGKGGKSYTAFDITTPPSASASESSLATSGLVLWEFTDPDMGFTYGNPLIVKTQRYGWVAVLPGGYNNSTGPNPGKGIVFVVDVKTGTLLHKFVTPDGSAASPLGLAHIEAFVPDVTDYVANEIYGGDLFGNVWRFNIGGTAAFTASGIKFATVKDANGAAQPITTYPVPYADPITGARFVAVGTGKLLDAPDLLDLQQQTLYNFRDGTVFSPDVPATPLTRANLTAVSRATAVANVPLTAKGWYQDLVASSGERIIKAPDAPFGTLIAFSITPSSDPCVPAAFGTAYARQGSSGNSVINPAGTTFLGGVGSNPFVGSRVVKLKSGKPEIQILDSEGKISTLKDIKLPGGFQGTVVNYREIIE
jgi:type IV pilus assembly protein PilY1